ncbi:UPF0547 protein C16orf87 homolog isoform X2 [Aethina tumida]|uniref:UPF0547 protein C16orf87 homolog isoform X2 n=1 Tax=Aethina tumida TaxID=116153 RepID=UPI00096AF76F|nr:UPF0547 protein C16orf87 homolog isoform X2 [Aethina tumida]
MIAKGCPKCEQQVPVACKACRCGYSFFNAKRVATKVLSPTVDSCRRRTQRVRREKPNYYDALEFDKQVRKTKRRHSECDLDDEIQKGGKNKRRKVKKEEEDDDEAINNLSPEKQYQCALILEELNRKLQIVTWKPT